jgi:hypothetical protein
VEVSGQNGIQTAEIRDISRAGARLLVRESIGAAGDTVELFLPSDGDSIAVMAEIAHVVPQDGGEMVSLRFVVVEPSSQEAFYRVIDALLRVSGRGSSQRSRPVRQLVVPYESDQLLRQRLEEMQAGTLRLRGDHPVALHDEVDVLIAGRDDRLLFAMPGRVARHRSTSGEGEGDWDIGIELHEPGVERKAVLRALLQHLDSGG